MSETALFMAFFVPGKLRNPLNGDRQHWAVVGRERAEWRQRTAAAVYSTGWSISTGLGEIPKRVTFVAHTWNGMDSDGLQASLKSVRDALVQLGLLNGDAPKDGNVFVYDAVIDRKRRGVQITVEALR